MTTSLFESFCASESACCLERGAAADSSGLIFSNGSTFITVETKPGGSIGPVREHQHLTEAEITAGDQITTSVFRWDYLNCRCTGFREEM